MPTCSILRLGVGAMLPAVAFHLVSCAASPASTLILESESYACGAAPGLGCGLALAPVLEDLDELEGVERSQVSWDGRYFRIDLLPGADGDRVSQAAAALLA